MALRLTAEECARSLLRLYESQPLAGVRVERLWSGMGDHGDQEVDVYVKSTLEPSIDEIPVLQAIIDSLQGVRVTLYSYDPVSDQGQGKGYVAFRLVERGLRLGKPFILVLPGQRSLVLARYLEGEEWEVIEESLAIKVTVRAGNVLYLPEPGEATVRLVAKSNSEQAYERVQWLTGIARELGLRLSEPKFLPSNREIFEHVFSLGRRGPIERVPVNKLAAYTSVLGECGYLDGINRYTRVESSTHYIYAHRVPGWLLERIAERLESIMSIELGGPLYSLAFQGTTRVFEEILSRIGVPG